MRRIQVSGISASGELGLYPPPCGEGRPPKRSEGGRGGGRCCGARRVPHNDPHPKPLPTRERFLGPRNQIVGIIQIFISVQQKNRSGRLHIGSTWLSSADRLTFPAIMAHLQIHPLPTGYARASPHSRAAHQTTYLGVRRSNLFGRANNTGTSRRHQPGAVSVSVKCPAT